MNKFFIIILVCFILFSPVIVLGQASSDCTSVPDTRLCNPLRFSGDNLPWFVFRLISLLTGFFALTVVIRIVFSGFQMALSQGDEEKLSVAKSSFVWSIYGLILSVLAFVLIYATGEFIGARDPDATLYGRNDVVRNPLQDPTFLDLLYRMLFGFLSIAGTITILMVIIGGLRYITSRGDEEQAEKGKKTLQWAILGLITILLAYVLVRATFTFFGV